MSVRDGRVPMQLPLIDERTALISGPTAALLSWILTSPSVQTAVRVLPAGLRPYRGEITAALVAVQAAAAAWSPERDAARTCEDAMVSTAVVPESGPVITTTTAAARLGVSRRRAQELVVAGVIAGRKVGRAWLVDADSVDQVARMRRGRSA